MPTPSADDNTTLARVIATHAAARPHNAAFITDGIAMSWRDYHFASDRLAGLLLEAGFERGDRLGILLPDSAAVHAAFLACEKAGLVAVGISPRAGSKEIGHVLRVAGAVALLSNARHNGLDITELFADLQRQGCPLRSHLQPVDALFTQLSVDGVTRRLHCSPQLSEQIEQRRRNADELFLINSTSGTTGMPKCIGHHQRRWLRFADYVFDSAELSAADVFLSAVPSSVGFGLWSAHFAPAVLGATTVLLSKFTVEDLLEAMALQRVSVLAAVSTQLIMLLNALEQHPRALPHLRVLYTGGEAVPYERAARFEAMTGAVVLQFYGSNEAGALSYTTARDSQEQRLRTAGRVIPAMQVQLLEPADDSPAAGNRGRPICRGPLLSLGYYNDPAANQKLYTSAGFMRMDDIVTIDEQGYLSVVGRVGDFIIRGGKNISAAAVEESALAHAKIAAAAAVAMPDAVFGEKVCLYVALNAGTTLTLPELVEFLRQAGVSKENLPERLIVLDELPMVSGGKIAKQKLREDIRQRLAQEGQTATTD